MERRHCMVGLCEVNHDYSSAYCCFKYKIFLIKADAMRFVLHFLF